MLSCWSKVSSEFWFWCCNMTWDCNWIRIKLCTSVMLLSMSFHMFHLLIGAVDLFFLSKQKGMDLVGRVYSNLLLNTWIRGGRITRWISSLLPVSDPTFRHRSKVSIFSCGVRHLQFQQQEKSLKWLWSALETKQTGWLSSGGCFRSSSTATARRGPRHTI